MANELTQRERFILHSVMVSMTLETAKDIDIPHKKILEFIRVNRCRDLSIEEIDKLIDDVRLEMTLSKSMWDEFGIPRR
jgi:hypothetical protein